MIKSTQEQVVSLFINAHGNTYDYSKVLYSGMHEKVEIICKHHGSFIQKPNNHINGMRCPICGDISRRKLKTLTTEQFILKSNIKHNNRYDYSNVVYVNAKTKVKLICPKHGEYEQTPSDHLSGCGCPICKLSKGALKVKNWLDQNNVKYEVEKKFDGCINKSSLPFDFYLPEHNCCIEYDGKTHFEVIPRSKDQNKNLQTFITQGINDLIKDTFCITNNIKLVRIPYFKENEMFDILSYEVVPK